MMGGLSPETCWASHKYGITKFWYIVASCWIFPYELCYDAWIHEHQNKEYAHGLCRWPLRRQCKPLQEDVYSWSAAISWECSISHEDVSSISVRDMPQNRIFPFAAVRTPKCLTTDDFHWCPRMPPHGAALKHHYRQLLSLYGPSWVMERAKVSKFSSVWRNATTMCFVHYSTFRESRTVLSCVRRDLSVRWTMGGSVFRLMFIVGCWV